MEKETWDNKYDVKTVSTKISQSEFSKLKVYCEQKGVSPSTLLRDLVFKEMETSIPVNISGRNVFIYNKGNDTFSWRILLDDGSRKEMVEELSPAFVEQLFFQLEKAKEERDLYLKKDKEDSVPVPSKIVGEKG